MRILKRWRYVGVYGPEMMLCAGIARVGGVPQCFWAVSDRERRLLHERTRRRLGAVALPDGAVRVRDGGVAIDLLLAPAGEAIAVRSRHGGGEIRTRKAPVTARGTVGLDGRSIAVDGPALVDDSSGFHARETAWTDAPAPAAPPPGARSRGTSSPARTTRRAAASGGSGSTGCRTRSRPSPSPRPRRDRRPALRRAEAQRARHDRVLFGLLVSEYRQPFGTFTGTLPGGVALAEGYGVMQRHRARW